ncbi:2,6-dihydroxypyridine 3-monooxygenase [Arthrobacter sp. 1088]|uniref:FAD binding domain-containing protein n=1 Tax=Arthrobacter sp. 1088 TaxID=2817768 RepID=UPI002866B150|nr:FAD-dependent monooxygenase [Arthrobacter sp. 1088]MDR6688665.1 2,6-dihydroxypyridine 3-monooxygenase [Arthrobacter sp. 1088]
MTTHSGKRALILGGSIGGLTAGLLLKDLGFDVSIFERTFTELGNRGGGIVLQPDTLRWFRERSSITPEAVSTSTQFLRYIGEGNKVLFEEQAEWHYSSWSVMYNSLLSDFGRENYVLGEYAVGFDQDAEGVDVRFVSGRTERADLAVFADGITSVGRKRLYPEAGLSYSGYIGWRGTVLESEVSPETAELLGSSLTYSIGPNTQICMYPIPGPDNGFEVGKRLLNYVWYRNVAEGPELEEILTDKRGFTGPVSVHPGQVQDRFITEMKHAAKELLAPAAAELVNLTAEPYIQPVLDVRTPRMVEGRVALIGDAAFAARPHAAAAAAKAAADAWALAAALEENDSVTTALAKWEPGQLHVGNNLIDRVTIMGARSQFHNTWTPGDPDLRFGLYGPGQ